MFQWSARSAAQRSPTAWERMLQWNARSAAQRSPTAWERMSLRRLTLANLIANVGIVVTGGAVRLTGSGLGCPTWPKCTEDSYTATPALGINGFVEFGNRALSMIVGAIALATLIAAWRSRPEVRKLAIAVFALVLLQGVIGGLTVRMNLDPYFVGPHFLVSMVILVVAHRLWKAAGPAGHASRPSVLTWTITAASALVVMLGVMVTGSGPHAGDDKSVRTGLDPELISQIHADVVFLLLGLVIAGWLAGRDRKMAILLAVILAQGLIGFVQYFTGLPEVLVGAHMAGACLVWLATLELFYPARVASVLPGQSNPHREMVTVS